MSGPLRECIRGLVVEMMQGPHGLPADVTVLIQDVSPAEFRVRYADETGSPIQLQGPGYVRRDTPVADQVYGLVNCVRRGKQYADAYEVTMADAKKGYGPLLYDVAMEYATMLGGGLMSDRSQVSKSAYGVWKRYMARPDVEAHALRPWPDAADVPGHVGSAREHDEIDAIERDDSPLVLRFTKEAATIRRLEALGKLVHRPRAKRA